MDERLSILVLHALGDFTQCRATSLNHVKCYQKYCPNHLYFYHDIYAPVTPALKAFKFQAVILDTTFLCIRYTRPRFYFEEIRKRYSFLRELNSIKVALPQDEYDHCAILDEWLEEIGVDVVYSVCWDDRAVFYPRLLGKGVEVCPALTGYIDDDDVQLYNVATPFSNRGIDVGYRARQLPPEFGRYGRLKTDIAEMFVKCAKSEALKLDISTRPEDVFLGDAWRQFLVNSKFTLGLEGGSSILDPYGHIRDSVHQYLSRHPGASFAEVSENCFSPSDDGRIFSAISPRTFEVAAAGSAQILVKGKYLGILRPNEHYLLLEPDFSNIHEVFRRMKDSPAAERMIMRCYESLILDKQFHYSTFAAHVVDRIRSLVTRSRLCHSTMTQYSEFLRLHTRQLARAPSGTPISRRDRIRLFLKKITPAPLVTVLRGVRSSFRK